MKSLTIHKHLSYTQTAFCTIQVQKNVYCYNSMAMRFTAWKVALRMFDLISNLEYDPKHKYVPLDTLMVES